jgi:hypothetical protein
LEIWIRVKNLSISPEKFDDRHTLLLLAVFL